jgi:hypothetical protein
MTAKFARHLGAAWQFVIDVKIGYDLGCGWPNAICFAWSIWGWRQ